MGGISGSRYFNDPQLAAAASNLAGLFAPPSGADAAGWAAANAKREEASRMSALFDYRNDPNFSQEQFDRMGEAAGAWHPDQGYYSVNQGNQTLRRGQDIVAGTSRANNADDNARALETNRLTELGNLFDPLAQGATRPAIPTDIASQFGVPHGLVAEHGQDIPQSETQLKASIMAGMPIEQQRAITFGSTPIDPIVTPAGPRNVLRTDAIGQVPYDKPTAGMSVDIDPVTGKVTSISTGGGDKGLTADQSKLANFSATAEAMLGPLDKMGADLTDLTGGLASNVPGGYGNYLQSENYQKATIVAERFVQSVLRNESGAATPNEEITKYNATFIPRPGDKPGTIRLKSWLRKVAADAMDTGLSKAARLAKVDAAAAAGPPPDFMPTVAADTTKPAVANTAPDAAAPTAAVAPVTTPSPTSAVPTQAAIDFLKAHPDAAAEFDLKYGPGAAARATGGQ